MSNEKLKEILEEERISLHELLIPSVSKKEMDEIKKKYGSPDKYHAEAFVDLTDLIKN